MFPINIINRLDISSNFFRCFFYMFTDGKYHMLPTGELLIINVSHSDAQHTYRCRTYHQLTQEVIVSGNFGRIQLTGNFKIVNV